MSWRVSFEFEHRGEKTGGWSENFWQEAEELSTAIVRANRLRDALAYCHGRQSVLRRIRFAQLGSFRLTHVVKQFSDTNSAVSATEVTDYPTVSALLQMRGDSQVITRQWLKGIPDEVTKDGGFFRPTGSLLNAFNALCQYLSGGNDGWVMRVQNPARLTYKPQSITQTGLLTFSGPTFTADDKIRITRAKGNLALNKVWGISAAVGNTIQLDNGGLEIGTEPYSGGAKVRKQDPVLRATLTYAGGGVTIVRTTSHRIGRPSGLLGGRRRTRKS